MVEFFLNNKKVVAKDDETIWAVAKKEGITLPHLCFADKPDFIPNSITSAVTAL